MAGLDFETRGINQEEGKKKKKKKTIWKSVEASGREKSR